MKSVLRKWDLFMKKKMLGSCPVCNGELEVTSLQCKECKTEISGHFEVCGFCKLDKENRDFIETFIKCRGSIKDVERELGISYPTVKNRLDRVIKALGYEVTEATEPVDRMEVLTQLEKGEISVEQALKQLRGEE